MTKTRYNVKRDANEPAIVDYLKARGVSVERLHTPVDLLLGYRGKTYLAEVKDGNAKLNARQREFFAGWNGAVPSIFRTTEDVENWLRQR